MKKQKGQMILVILLVMTVGLTIGLSVASRSITDVSFSTKLEESNRAFSAAETGIEESLRQGIYAAPPQITGTAGSTKYNVNLASYGNLRNYSFPDIVEAGDGQTVWLTAFDPTTGLPQTTVPVSGYRYPTNRWLAICWSKGDPSSAIIPALEVSLFFADPPGGNNNIKVTRLAYDPDTSRTGTGFISGNPPISRPGTCDNIANTYDYRVNMLPYCAGGSCPTPMTPNPQNANSILVALRLKPIYAKARLAVRGDFAGGPINLPEQGKNITSSGKTDSGVTRKWNVIQTYSSAPDIFDYAVWSNTDLTNN